MAAKKILLGTLVLALSFGFVLTGCSNPAGGVDGNVELVNSLPAFEGAFAADETEVRTLQSGADAQIELAIADALAQAPQRSIGRAAVSANGHYEWNGVTVDYTATGNTTGNTYPLTYAVKALVTIDGTYSGYKIKGKYNLNEAVTYNSAVDYSIIYNYDCVYTVSYNGKGMKLIYTGNMAMTSSAAAYNVHYAVYDNTNELRYNFDYKYP
jgi:hypothetical protein